MCILHDDSGYAIIYLIPKTIIQAVREKQHEYKAATATGQGSPLAWYFCIVLAKYARSFTVGQSQSHDQDLKSLKTQNRRLEVSRSFDPTVMHVG
jgi:hypothetical protein